MIICKFHSPFRILHSFSSKFQFIRPCSTAINFLNPDGIGDIAFKFDDKRVSNLLFRLRKEYDDSPKRKLSLSMGYSDFLDRLANIERKLGDVHRQLEELKKHFPDCQPTSNRSKGGEDILKEDAFNIETTDSELAKLVDDDRQILTKERRQLENVLLSELAVWLISGKNGIQKETNMPKDLILEVSAGVGGQEAMLFTREIFDMYRRYAQFRQWEFNIIEEQSTDLNGLHFATASISGTDAYARLRFEGGVHRVQRVPATEKNGRVHTSTMSVAILAQPSPSEEKVNLKEFRFETFRACAPGGQNVNKSDSGSRITHLPTGIIVSCQMERQALVNRDLALRRILAILYDRKADAQRGVVEQSRKLQVGSLSRSEKIRTYNYTQDRITDHRTKHSFVGIPDTLAGGEGLERIVQCMLKFNLEERLSEALDEEKESIKSRDILNKVG